MSHQMEDRSMPDATVVDFEDIIRETDPNESEGSTAWKAKLVMLCSLKLGQDAAAISTFSGVARAEVELFFARLQENAVWIGGEWVNFNPWSGEDSGTDFNIATNIATGDMIYNPVTEMLQLTAQGKERAEQLIDGGAHA